MKDGEKYLRREFVDGPLVVEKCRRAEETLAKMIYLVVQIGYCCFEAFNGKRVCPVLQWR